LAVNFSTIFGMKRIYTLSFGVLLSVVGVARPVGVGWPETRPAYTVELSQTADRAITGKVTDESGAGLPGVSVVLKGTQRGTTTNTAGSFSINVPDAGAVLVFSFVGYGPQEIAVGAAQTSLTVSLKADNKSLNEVVVVGYGSVRKSDLTGSVVSIKAEELNRSVVSSFDQGLSGRVAGVQVTQQTGQPGGANSVRIRGGNSINSANEPLYVIDGFPYYNDNNAAAAGNISGAPAVNALATLNPGDIESLEVLKDASATAIYGARGANGVILITTKRGKPGKGRIDIDSYYGTQEVIKILPVLNARQYAEFRNDAFVNSRGLNGTGIATYTQQQIDAFGEGTNWQREIFRTAPIQNHQVTFTGGTEAVRYAISGNYFDQQGIVLNSDLKRYSIRANVDAKLSSKFSIGNNFTVSHIKSDLARTGGGVNGTTGVQNPGSGNIIQDALFYNPTIPVRRPDGSFTSDNNSDTGGLVPGGNNANTGNGNPVAFATLSTQESRTTRALNNLYAEYEPIADLKVRVSVGADVIYNKSNSFLPSTIFQGRTAPNGEGTIGSAISYSWLNENTVSYAKRFGAHNVSVLAGLTMQDFRREAYTVSGRDFPTNLNNVQNIGAANVLLPGSSNYTRWSLLSYLGRVNYAFADRYLFTVTARADGSSRFGTNNQFGFFPSAAFAWKLQEEPFVKQLGVFTDLKLRLSAGRTGNQEIPAYQALSVLNTVRYPTDNVTNAVGLMPGRLGNPDIKWETTTQYDAGLDVSVLGGRVNLTTDLYYKRTSDLLLAVRLPFSSGYDFTFQNIGAVENKGIELGLNTINVDNALRWTTNFNIAFNRNKVLDLGGETERYIGTDYNLTKGIALSVLRVGEPVGQFVGYINEGILRNDEEVKAAPVSPDHFVGSRRFRDLNGDRLINDADRAVIGNALPKFTGGFQNTITYKNLELDALLGFSYGNQVYNMNQLELEFLNGRQNQSTTVLDRFVPGKNENTDVARAGITGYVNVRQSHSRWVEDASFLRLRNLTLAYNVPVQKLGLSGAFRSLRVYVQGQNLLTLTPYRGYDPEVNINPQSNTLLGFDYATYPSAKVYTAGLRLGF
jgi:TonB-dependent starch-binding outer membrane protein SusC